VLRLEDQMLPYKTYQLHYLKNTFIRVGYLEIDYRIMWKVFGPSFLPANKSNQDIDDEWHIKFGDGVCAQIYNTYENREVFYIIANSERAMCNIVDAIKYVTEENVVYNFEERKISC
jgi:hypothetical protein